MHNLFSTPIRQKIVQDIVSQTKQALKGKEEKLHSNVIDPFSAIFDASIANTSYSDWINSEKLRQNQKSLQNKIGDFHQQILGSFPDWEDPGSDGVIDLYSRKHKIIAEIKNKYNTTNSTSKLGAYDTLAYAIDRGDYKGYTAYFVEIIPKNAKKYNKCFVPSDPKASQLLRKREDIRITDGYTFYDIVTKEKNSLEMCFKFIAEELKKINSYSHSQEEFYSLFNKAFKQV